MKPRWALAAIFLCLLVSRLAHVRLVWVEEGYPSAAAIQMVDYGKTLYRDIWFDKPPATALLYCLWGGQTGFALRLADALFLFACCVALWALGRALFGSEREGLLAAALLAFYLTFGIPAAVMAMAPDMVALLPEIVALWLAARGRAFLAGIAAGVGICVNTKAVFGAAACLLFVGPRVPVFCAGFGAAITVQCGWLVAIGAWQGYVDQVWRWGAMYARDSFVENPVAYGVKQTLNWCGFQGTAVLGAAAFFWQRNASRWKFGVLVLLAFLPVVAGLRFFPRYYFGLLPVCALLAARAFWMSGRAMRMAMLVLLIAPAARFGPRYVQLAVDAARGVETEWSDLALANDSRHVADLLRDAKGTLFVWGYRPDIFALTRMRAATAFLDSQPVSGVIADRHLRDSQVSAWEWRERYRDAVPRAKPDYIVDGLSPLNPAMAMPAGWLADYERIGATRDSFVYRRHR